MSLQESRGDPTPGVAFQWPVLKSATTPKEEKVNLTEMAADAVIEAKGDTAASVTLLLKRLRKDHRDLYNQKAEDAMRAWAQEMIRHGRGSLRTRLADAPIGAVTEGHQPLNAESLRSVGMAWFDWPVLPGVMLRDATKADLEKASGVYLCHAAVYVKRGNWLHSIAEALPDDATKVSAALSEDAVAQLASTHGVASS